MTRTETTIAIILTAILFILIVILKQDRLTDMHILFLIGYLSHFAISKFDTNSDKIIPRDETKFDSTFAQVLVGIPIIKNSITLYTFETFLAKCDADLYNEFYKLCFDYDCFTIDNQEINYMNNQEYFSQLLTKTLKIN